ncbi:MAG: porin family protein [Prevotella sp.]|nr:porin family protein [Bacteroides sp.]MCM1366832.1 porin family protein [Prevotella sp.]MCM1437182.1 porin family protein [Prevotella sp.]
MTGFIRHIICLAIAIFSIATASNCSAQEDYRFDIGLGLGMTGYLGDANTANLWKNPGFDGELLFRYIVNPRWGLKTNLYVGTLRGNSAQMTNVMPSDINYKFSTTFVELGEIAEFNFFNFGMGESYRKLKRITPYIAAGLGFNYWKVDSYNGFAFNIPFGIGVKYKLNRRVNLGLEFLMKKVFTDKLDGPQLDDPYLIKSSFLKNTDWYSTLTFTVTYEFSKRCAVCHYKD